ncbi:MAG TPA: hypothetical protein VG845_04890 [Dehalococcoidia bacterium]|jgi:hypothetical protein|nr:hypothetical protein [Dehalococcoidia bacterium]
MASEVIAETQTEEYQTPLPRPLLVVAGGVLLASIMLLTAFSLGVWWANGQETTAASFGFGGGARPPGGGAQGPATGQQAPNFGGFGGAQGAQGGAGAQNAEPALSGAAVDLLPRNADVVGTITSYSRNVVTVATRAGSRFVIVNSDTKIYRADASEGTTQSLARGSGIAIVTRPSQDGRSQVAEVIALLAPSN